MSTEARLDTLPSTVWDCERCGTERSMQLRRGSLNESFMAEDIGLKCSECYYYATHGVPFTDSEQFEKEWNNRDGRVNDYTQEDNEFVKERLENLGYLAKADSV